MRRYAAGSPSFLRGAVLILGCAARFVPLEARVEWMAEWGGELAYVRRTQGRTRAIAFCLGAFPDALWLRRSLSPAEPWMPAILGIESPIRCLTLLAILAAGSTLALLPAGVRDELWPPPYRDAEKLAMVSRHPGVTPQIAEIPVQEYRFAQGRTAGAVDVAFYAPIWARIHGKPLVVAVASPNLLSLLGMRISAPGLRPALILSRTAMRRYFGGDERMLGQPVEIAGVRAVIAGIVADGGIRLPGPIDGWLLDADRLAALAPGYRGFMVARLRTAPPPAGLRWPMSTPNERGGFDTVGLAPMPSQHVFLTILIIFAASFLAMTALSLGEYPSNRNSPALAIRVRRWMFLLVKLAFLFLIAFGGLVALGAYPCGIQSMLFGFAGALRWALHDQRNRCPVCLHSLSHPVRIGEASHTFLAWYGTELLCARGHGLLHVAELRTSYSAGQRWLYLDPSWIA